MKTHNFVGCRVLRSKVLETHPLYFSQHQASLPVQCRWLVVCAFMYVYVSQLPHSCEVYMCIHVYGYVVGNEKQ